MIHRVLRLVAVLFVCTASVGLFAQAGDTREEQLPISLSLAYAGENIIHAGALVSLNVTPVKHGIQELVLSANTAFFVFRPFYTSLLLGARAQYKLHFPSGLGLRLAGLTASYKHTFMLAEVYAVEDGEVKLIRDPGYGNLNVLVATGVEYDFSDVARLPFSAFADFGISAEPYFGVLKFHLELSIGMTYHLTKE
jgi:hypothetical protein